MYTKFSLRLGGKQQGHPRRLDLMKLVNLNVDTTYQNTSAADLDSPIANLILETFLSSCEDSGIDSLPDGKLPNLEYADDIILLSEDPGKLQAFLDSLSASKAMFGMHVQNIATRLGWSSH
ncbi:unnamed protein product [Echinostoma caproni]|uniref:Reverse transcriptase domain-containing protein n=1 Tax=Echinostoma caproni TaxID=27848 RepID=A0A183BD29_9TREM|nr:unnamed protein product [Echinostoma caproni]